jgi:hypothetical protein
VSNHNVVEAGVSNHNVVEASSQGCRPRLPWETHASHFDNRNAVAANGALIVI